jgi:4-diphosphocytidyl-2-C-methyl-D-erythritol kinase
VNHSSISLPSFAKINWSLQILGKRPDDYHEVRTILQTISLHDDLHFVATGDDEVLLSCNEPDIPTNEQNLIVRAAYALKDRYNVDKGARIQLEKRIPAKAGLGGASSNAAVSLLALAQIWRVEASTPALLEIAATLGADVPFFLLGGRAMATGIGTTLSPDVESADTQDEHLIVITPKAAVSTAKAYAALSSRALTTTNPDPILSSSRSAANSGHSPLWSRPGSSPDDLKNDFESVIFDIEPEIRRTKEALLQAGALGALMAGSGSSVFGVFADREDQERAVNEIKLEAGWRIFSCVTVSRKEYLRALGSSEV